MDRALFEAVQAKLTEQRAHNTVTRTKSAYLLSGLLFDDAGHRVTTSHATKNKIRYRYYVSWPVLRGAAKRPAGSISRVPAPEIEAAVIRGLKARFSESVKSPMDQDTTEREFITANVARIEVRNDQLAVRLQSPDADDATESRCRHRNS